ncbi:MAG: peptide ABC transporter substrate-binding protein [Candidatus Nitrohelix vancouverensis]|uniref:Peptide ABC transporter substrate-binding protein n=1 Tax=Candidatus Nitrohelix vancouverensis TaxID=2705534 RepID=A0A7T0C1S3_9BACT|nr:MAG: peptide ABC transporter substrate-binding protein [Candidatus Nitrohelix vancouverensis]
MKRQALSRTAILILFCLFVASCTPENVKEEPAFRLALRAEPPTLDWTLATDSISFNVLTNIMEGLTQYNAQLEPQPAIAKRWELSKDNKTILFYLRDDVFWSDGKAVTAEDFEYAWKRLLNPATAAQYAYFLFDLENAEEYNAGRIKDASKVGVRALGPQLLEVKLKKPAVYFPSITTFMVTFPQRRDIVERYGDRWTDPKHIVTNGPFLLSEWHHEYKLVLRANPGYYDSPPRIDRVDLYVVEEPTTALTLYETGELDMIELAPVAIEHYKNSPEYQNMPQLRGYYYGFNALKKPFDDARVRRALAHSIDRSKIPLILKGGEAPSASWIPKGMFGHNPEIGAHFNPELARRLLAEAGFPDGQGFPKVAAMYNTGDIHRLIGEFLQAQWKQHLNIEIEFDSQEWKVFLNRLQTDPPAMFRLGWGADFPDPDNFMNLFISTSGNNRMQWSHPPYDALVAQGSAVTDPKQRLEIYDEAQRILTESEAAMIPLFTSAMNLLVRPYVKGFEMNAMELLYIKRIYLEGNRSVTSNSNAQSR